MLYQNGKSCNCTVQRPRVITNKAARLFGFRFKPLIDFSKLSPQLGWFIYELVRELYNRHIRMRDFWRVSQEFIRLHNHAILKTQTKTLNRAGSCIHIYFVISPSMILSKCAQAQAVRNIQQYSNYLPFCTWQNVMGQSPTDWGTNTIWNAQCTTTFLARLVLWVIQRALDFQRIASAPVPDFKESDMKMK